MNGWYGDDRIGISLRRLTHFDIRKYQGKHIYLQHHIHHDKLVRSIYRFDPTDIQNYKNSGCCQYKHRWDMKSDKLECTFVENFSRNHFCKHTHLEQCSCRFRTHCRKLVHILDGCEELDDNQNNKLLFCSNLVWTEIRKYNVLRNNIVAALSVIVM